MGGEFFLVFLGDVGAVAVGEGFLVLEVEGSELAFGVGGLGVGGDAVVVDEVDGAQGTLQAVLHFLHLLVDGEAVLLPLLLRVAQLLDQALALLALGLGALQKLDCRLGGGRVGSGQRGRLLLNGVLLRYGFLEVAIGELSVGEFGDELCVLLQGFGELLCHSLVIYLLFFYIVLEGFPLFLETGVLLVPQLPLLRQPAPPPPYLFLQLLALFLHFGHSQPQSFYLLHEFFLFFAGRCD